MNTCLVKKISDCLNVCLSVCLLLVCHYSHRVRPPGWQTLPGSRGKTEVFAAYRSHMLFKAHPVMLAVSSALGLCLTSFPLCLPSCRSVTCWISTYFLTSRVLRCWLLMIVVSGWQFACFGEAVNPSRVPMRCCFREIWCHKAAAAGKPINYHHKAPRPPDWWSTLECRLNRRNAPEKALVRDFARCWLLHFASFMKCNDFQWIAGKWSQRQS